MNYIIELNTCHPLTGVLSEKREAVNEVTKRGLCYGVWPSIQQCFQNFELRTSRLSSLKGEYIKRVDFIETGARLAGCIGKAVRGN